MTSQHANLLFSPAPISTRPLQWQETEVPTAGDGQLLIRVVACGVCRSNLHMIEGDWVDGGVPAFSPIVPGHEVTGFVEAIGAGVDGFVVGDAVGVQPLWSTCETCEFCTSGREQLCHDRLITGEHVDGGYGEYMVSTALHTYHLPDGLDPIDAAPLFCPGITAYGAVSKLDVGPGSRVAIFGLGGVGHMAVQFAVLTGAEVVAVGRTPEHLTVAGELGATVLVDSRDPEALAAIADTADAVLTFAPADAVTLQAFDALKWGGTLVTAVPLNVSFPFNKGQTIKASIIGSRADMREVLRIAATGAIRTVVDRFEMSEAGDVLETLAAGAMRSRAVLYNA